MMLPALLCFGIFTFTQANTEERQVVSPCIETCIPNVIIGTLGIGRCQEGYECRSNGCGHTCQKVTGEVPIHLGSCIEACSIIDSNLGLHSCPNGYECKSNGCGHTCQKVAVVEKKQIFGACIEACSLGDTTSDLGFGTCQKGYECKFNGCGHTCQKVS